ncbi:MAG: hypothetical protein FJZ09_02775 [Candidatus Omnitrophica bacterium]|nr:hypothetical protein [Candidatus Omnitrophota bacterium]
MNKYLATTGISSIWDLDGKLFLLGPWCLAGKDNIKLLEARSYEMIPSPFKPATKIKEAADYCQVIYAELLPRVSDKLNVLHGASYPLRYWEVLLGYWLMHFIGIFYDRYRRLEHAFDLFPDVYTHALPYGQCSLASIDTYDTLLLNGKINDDYYNLKLFSLIAHAIFPENTAVIEYKENAVSRSKNETIKRKIFRFFLNSSDIFQPQVIFSGMSQLQPVDSMQLKWRTGIRKVGFKDFNAGNSESYDNFSPGAREKLTLEGGSDRFRELLYKVLPYAIPMCYVEDYDSYHGSVKNSRKVKAVGSAGDWYFNERFKFFAAESAVNGAKLLDFQHGGGYGVSFSIPHEKLCLEKDAFFTWGWKDKEGRAKPLPVPYLSKVRDKHSCSLENLLFVSTSLPKYQYRFEACMQPEDMFGYLGNMKSFFRSLRKEIVKETLFRPNIEGGWNVVPTIKEGHPDLTVVTGGRLVEWMKKAKLVVADHAHTSFLEALVINVPSVFYWDHDVYLMRPEAEDYFELLRKAGILHRSPESAAKKVNEIWHDSAGWWKQPGIQDARNKFCQRFALTSENWLNEWTKALETLLGGA